MKKNTNFGGKIDNIEMNVKKKEGPNMKLIKNEVISSIGIVVLFCLGMVGLETVEAAVDVKTLVIFIQTCLKLKVVY